MTDNQMWVCLFVWSWVLVNLADDFGTWLRNRPRR